MHKEAAMEDYRSASLLDGLYMPHRQRNIH